MFFCLFVFNATQSVGERMLLFFGLHADLWSKFKPVSQEVGVLWGPRGPHLSRFPYLSAIGAEAIDAAGMLRFCPSLKALNHLWQF